MQAVLPNQGDFSDKRYWENFFRNRSNSFEWYGSYIDLIDIFTKYVKIKDSIMIIGCGNSTLSNDLKITQKCKKICSIDTSETVIKQLKTKYKKSIKLNEFDFIECDVTKDWNIYESLKSYLPFTCVIDKGTTDAIYSSDSMKTEIMNMWDRIENNLPTLGRYILITLAQEHIVDGIVEKFIQEKNSDNCWMITVHEMTSITSYSQSFKLPIFVFIFHKMNPNSTLPKVYIDEDAFSKHTNLKTKKVQLTTPIVELKEWIQQRQQLSMMVHSSWNPRNPSTNVVDLISKSTGRVRYHCVFVKGTDEIRNKIHENTPFCVFLVPFMLHDDFASEEYRQTIVDTRLQFSHCLFVFLNCLEFYTSKDAIQSEITSLAIKFCLDIVPFENYSIPFVSSHTEVYTHYTEPKSIGTSLLLETMLLSNTIKMVRVINSVTHQVIRCNVALTEADMEIEKWLNYHKKMFTQFVYLEEVRFEEKEKTKLYIADKNVRNSARDCIDIELINSIDYQKKRSCFIYSVSSDLDTNIIKKAISLLNNTSVLLLVSKEDDKKTIIEILEAASCKFWENTHKQTCSFQDEKFVFWKITNAANKYGFSDKSGYLEY